MTDSIFMVGMWHTEFYTITRNLTNNQILTGIVIKYFDIAFNKTDLN